MCAGMAEKPAAFQALHRLMHPPRIGRQQCCLHELPSASKRALARVSRFKNQSLSFKKKGLGVIPKKRVTNALLEEQMKILVPALWKKDLVWELQ
jgi:hypothetical protein